MRAAKTSEQRGIADAIHPAEPRKRRSPRWRSVASVAAVSALAVLGSAAAAVASTTSTGTSAAELKEGSLSIGASTEEKIAVPIAGSGNGILPQAEWTDSTGTGKGWNGTVAISDFSYTGSWSQTSGTETALGASSSAFTDTSDGVTYTVTVEKGGTTSETPYSWTSTDSTDKAGGTGKATNGTPVEIGTKGIKVNFASGTAYPEGATYQIHGGTLPKSALALDTAATGAEIATVTGTTSEAPSFVNNEVAVEGGTTVGSTVYGTAVKIISATENTGMGSYTVDPGAQVTADASAWKATYTAGVQYSIITGP